MMDSDYLKKKLKEWFKTVKNIKKKMKKLERKLKLKMDLKDSVAH